MILKILMEYSVLLV